jgi:hypothetical protein
VAIKPPKTATSPTGCRKTIALIPSISKYIAVAIAKTPNNSPNIKERLVRLTSVPPFLEWQVF